MRTTLRKLIPPPFLRAYHFCIAYLGALYYRFPSRKLIVVGVTGTKGKSSVTEMINAILEEAGYKTALLNSIRFKIADMSERNLLRMSMPGRFFIQHFLRRAVDAGCTVAVLEMTSEGAIQYRHRGIDLNAFVFLNLAPEHIERHGSYEAYADAKYELGKQLVRSHKRPRIMVANAEDEQGPRYLTLPVEQRAGFALKGREPYEASDRGGHFRFDRKDIAVHLPGIFSIKNAIAAAEVCKALGVGTHAIERGLAKLTKIPGRAETINEGQPFTAVVDYAHTPDSLEALYDAYKSTRKICVLGNTGGGRDTWKRPVMGNIADERCDVVILTNEDPYDEDPRAIVAQMAKGMQREPTVIMDRREAIRMALAAAKPGDAVLITGKGTDPCICVANGQKIPWSDAQVVREELRLLSRSQQV